MKDKSKLISSFIAKLKMAYPYYFKDFNEEDTLDMVMMYQDMLGSYNEATLNEVAKKIITTKKYMPSIAEILEICENTKVYVQNEIVEYMIQEGYFKSPNEIDKIYMWLGEGIIPKWFKEDMKKYYSKMIENKKLLIEG